MNSEEFSCIKQVVKTVQLSLPFMYVYNDIAGITSVLDSWKRQFVKQLNGIVVDYKNVSLTSNVGAASYLKSYAVYNVKATFDLFCPSIGDIVKGKINRISKEHIGCLIQGTINVNIHLPRDYPAELSKYVYIDGDILFEIANFSSEPKVVLVTGNITPKCIELMNNLFSSAKDSVSERENSSSDEETTHVNLSILNSMKALMKPNEDVKPKKLKKRKRESESSNMESEKESPKKKSPKKKKSKNLDSSLTDSTEKSSKKSKIYPNSIPTDFPEKSPKKKKSKIDLDSHMTDSESSSKKKKSQIKLDLSLADSESSSKEILTDSQKSPKKKKSKINLDSSVMDLMSPKKELERKDSTETIAFNPTAFNNFLETIKNEIGSSPDPPSSSTVLDVNKKKRKRTKTSTGELKDPGKKKKHKKKNKDELKSVKSKDKKKLSKKKHKVAASGSVLKKDKKSSKGKKPSKIDKADNISKTSKKKSKKDHKKNKLKKSKNKKIKLDTNFETEDVKKIKSESE